ncbi:MAG: ThuA domain-containing protein [Candidatus Hydrogenedentes bacterium]|nr:ThuA domain-containing protein [Candidatus Hydrogenedentota bacterium]
MAATSRIVFNVGGPGFHPVREQALRIQQWLGDKFTYEVRDGLDAFEALEGCDLLVLMGLHWTGWKEEKTERSLYHPMEDRHKKAFEAYVASGRPLIAHHGTIASYDDWPRYGELIGFTWVWGKTSHSPVSDHLVRIHRSTHPLVKDLDDYTIHDELYYDIQTTPGLSTLIHAEAEWQGRALPMIMSAEGGRVEGAGKVVYLANGHDMKAFECAAMQRIWANAVNWALGL